MYQLYMYLAIMIVAYLHVSTLKTVVLLSEAISSSSKILFLVPPPRGTLLYAPHHPAKVALTKGLALRSSKRSRVPQHSNVYYAVIYFELRAVHT